MIQSVTFHSNQPYVNKTQTAKRLGVMATGVAVGAIPAFFYYKNKNLTGKHLLFNSIEIGALTGLTADIASMMIKF